MTKRIFIPPEVIESIQMHLNSSIKKTLEQFSSSFENEDAFTGHLFGSLIKKNQNVKVNNPEIGGIWKWSIDYKKFGSGGKNSTESILGADGIIELQLNHSNGYQTSKNLLFQSKLDWTGKDLKLYKQCVKLLVWLGAVTIINYTQTNIEVFNIEDIINEKGLKPNSKTNLQNLIGDVFLKCEIGDSDLFYNVNKKELIWLDVNDKFVSTKFSLNRRLKILVEEPKRDNPRYPKSFETVPNDLIYKHRLKSNFFKNKVLSIVDPLKQKIIKNQMSHIFHPDKHNKLTEGKNILTNIMQEINNLIKTPKKKLK